MPSACVLRDAARCSAATTLVCCAGAIGDKRQTTPYKLFYDWKDFEGLILNEWNTVYWYFRSSSEVFDLGQTVSQINIDPTDDAVTELYVDDIKIYTTKVESIELNSYITNILELESEVEE